MANPEPKNRKSRGSGTRKSADVGVVLCDCSGDLRKRLDFAQLKKELNGLSSVALVKVCSGFCNATECADIVKALSQRGAKRLVIGGCSREFFENLLLKALKKSKLNRGLWWPVNIREQCALAQRSRKTATSKAFQYLSSAVSRVKLAEPVKSQRQKVRQDVMVVGGGIAGMRTAVTLAKMGHQVTIAHTDKVPGGMVAAMPEFYGYVGCDSGEAADAVTRVVKGLVREVDENKNIRVCSGSSLKSVDGELGNFTITVTADGKEQQVQAGAVVLASGSLCRSSAEAAGAGGAPSVTDLVGLLKHIRTGDVPARVAIMMDIISEQGRTISAQALCAAELLARRFGVQVKIFCNHVRVAATGLEQLYRRAREAGVVVVKYGKKPVISPNGSKIFVDSEDPIAETAISEEFDMVVMADCRALAEDADALNVTSGLRSGPDGGLQYDNVWLLPTLTNRPGVFVAGGARGNSEFREALMDGLAAANEIHELLVDGKIEIRSDTAVVDTDKCVLCLTCLRICPHGAIEIDSEKDAAYVSPVSCQRCGICAAECPAKAITLPGFTDEQIAVDVGSKPRVTVFACENSALPAADAAALNGYKYGSEVQLIRVPCAGKVDPSNVLSTLENGADKVLILGCHPESCKYLTGATRAEKRIKRLREMLEKAGLDKARVFFGGLASVEPAKFADYVNKENNRWQQK